MIFVLYMSGMKVSIAKSTIYASKGIPMEKRERIKKMLRMNFTNDIGKCLGFKFIVEE